MKTFNTTTTITITITIIIIIIIIIIIFFVRTETTTGPSISKCLTNSQENTKYKIMKTSRPNRAQSHFYFQRTMRVGYFLGIIFEYLL